MTDYISREALKKLFDGIYDCADLVFEPDDQICVKQHSSCGSCRWLETKRAIQKRVMSIPAADVRPVMKGKWEKRMNIDLMIWCSECGWMKHQGDKRNYNFCPNCGAKMEVEK